MENLPNRQFPNIECKSFQLITNPVNNYVLKSDTAGVGTWSTGGNSGTVTSITAGTGLTGGTITTSGTIDLANTAVTPASYTNANITVDAQGRITSAANGTVNPGTVTSITAGTGLTGGTITSSGTIDLANTTVTPASYTNANITVDAQGRITSAANGSSGATINTVNISSDTTLLNTSANVIIGSQQNIFNITLPVSPSNGVFYNFTQPVGVKVVLIANGKTFNLSYINIANNTFANISTNGEIYIQNSGIGSYSIYNLIYDATLNMWKSNNLGCSPLLQGIADASTITILPNRTYALYEERNTTPLALTFTEIDNAGRKYPNHIINITSTDANALIKDNLGNIISSAVTDNNGQIFFNVTSNNYSKFTSTIECKNPITGYDAQQNLRFTYDVSSVTPNKVNVINNNIDFATITCQVQDDDAPTNKFPNKNIEFTAPGTNITLYDQTGLTDGQGITTIKIKSDTLQNNILVTCENKTDNYFINDTALINFINMVLPPQMNSLILKYDLTDLNNVSLSGNNVINWTSNINNVSSTISRSVGQFMIYDSVNSSMNILAGIGNSRYEGSISNPNGVNLAQGFSSKTMCVRIKRNSYNAFTTFNYGLESQYYASRIPIDLSADNNIQRVFCDVTGAQVNRFFTDDTTQWTTVGWTYNSINNQIIFYINGVQLGIDFPWWPQWNAYAFPYVWIQNLNINDDFNFKAFYVYNIALTGQEMADLHNYMQTL